MLRICPECIWGVWWVVWDLNVLLLFNRVCMLLMFCCCRMCLIYFRSFYMCLNVSHIYYMFLCVCLDSQRFLFICFWYLFSDVLVFVATLILRCFSFVLAIVLLRSLNFVCFVLRICLYCLRLCMMICYRTNQCF